MRHAPLHPIARIGCVLALATFASSAHAQLITEPLQDDKYHVAEIEGGILRIDRQTGDVTECRNSTNGWICRLSADDRLAYEAEINRMDAEVERLESELANARIALDDDIEPDGSGRDLSPVPDGNSQSLREELNLPTEEELDAVMDTAEEVMRRFFDMVQTLRQDQEAQRAP